MASRLWNTGVKSSGALLPLGSIDEHWRLISVKGQSIKPVPAHVLLDQNMGGYFNTGESQWIGIAASGKGAPVSSPFVFQTSFDLDDQDVDARHAIEISGVWGVDNTGYITIDQLPLPPLSARGETSLPPGEVSTNFSEAHEFAIVAINIVPYTLQLTAGSHTLEVWVYNEGMSPVANPTAFNVAAANITVVPYKPTGGVRRRPSH